MGHYFRYNSVVKRVKDRGKMDILALGGSITAGGYFLEFARSLRERSNLTVTVHNHGHGATDITYTIFCVDIDHYEPDLVMIDFSVNDLGHPKVMEALIRKTLSMKSKPIVLVVRTISIVFTIIPPYHYHAVAIISLLLLFSVH
jgi:hypothetical protein